MVVTARTYVIEYGGIDVITDRRAEVITSRETGELEEML